MNWKIVALNALRWKMLALGAGAGLWGALLYESALLLPGSIEPPLRNLLAGTGLGLGLGLWLAPVDALMRHFFRRAARAALAGLLLGGAMGAVGSQLHDALLYAVVAVPGVGPAGIRGALAWLAPSLALGLIGGGIGLASGLVSVRRGRALWRGLLGLVAGTVLAAPVAWLSDADGSDPWALLVSLAAWSAVLTLILHWWEKRAARRWLRLLTGPGEDDVYPLDGRQITVGKNERNDIPLLSFQEIYPYHCELRWSADHYEIVDNEQGGVVLVNYRQVQEHALKPGDLIKIGSALLQYGEAS